MKKLIAKTLIGKEYMHSKQNCFFASTNADVIAKALNRNKFELNNDNEIWYVYDLDYGQSVYCDRKIWVSTAKGSQGQLKASYV